jgi:hypothetical protein
MRLRKAIEEWQTPALEKTDQDRASIAVALAPTLPNCPVLILSPAGYRPLHELVLTAREARLVS